MESKDEEYEIQCFGFSVGQMQYELRQLVRTHLEQLTTTLVESLTNEPHVTPMMDARIRKNIPKIVDNIWATSLPVMCDLDSLIQDSFHIPAGIVLAEDMIKAQDPSDNQTEAELTETMAGMMAQFKQNVQMMSVIDSEIQLHKKLLPVVEHEDIVADTVETCLRDTSTNLHDVIKAVDILQDTFEKNASI